jgi:hypothetical protein
VGGEHGVRHVVGGFAGQVPETGCGVAVEAAALDPDDGGDEGRPFGVVEMTARVEDLDVACLVSGPRGPKRVGWLALTWAIRRKPFSAARSKVFFDNAAHPR